MPKKNGKEVKPITRRELLKRLRQVEDHSVLDVPVLIRQKSVAVGVKPNQIVEVVDQGKDGFVILTDQA